jgi:hypothetical protein
MDTADQPGRRLILPPDSLTPEENLAFWAYDVFLRTQEEGRQLTSEENMAYGSLYRITTMHDQGQPLTAQERRMYDVYCSTIEVYEALHKGGAQFGEPRFEYLRGLSKERQKDSTWSIRRFDSMKVGETWSEIKGVAIPDAPLNAPRHRLGPPPDWPDSSAVDYVPPEAVVLTRKEKKEAKKKDKEDLERAKLRLEVKKAWLAREAAADAEVQRKKAEEEVKQKELSEKRKEAARKRRAELAAPPPPGLAHLLPPKDLGPSEEEVQAREREREAQRAREKARALENKSFIGIVKADGKPYEDLRLKEKANLSYQEVRDPYQMHRFRSLLPQFSAVRLLVLSHNDLEDLSFAKFPACEHLVLCGNNFVDFTKLPSCPQLQRLDMSDNRIWSLRGLRSLKIQALNCQDNPITVEVDYKQRVVAASKPTLTFLDDEPLDRATILPKNHKFDEELSLVRLDSSACTLL